MDKKQKETTLEELAAHALKQAIKAADSGTFGVGGILMDVEGNIICEMHNRVIKGNRTNDPTAHGERQIVDWYLANKEKENLPEPENCILITTLDPCVMCTGALAQIKFRKVIVVAPDDYAGINWEGTDACAALDGVDFQAYVKEHFAYPAVTGERSRKAFGAGLDDLDLFSDITISDGSLKNCEDAFILTADDVRTKISSVSVDIEDVKNPADLEPAHPIRRYLEESLGSDFLGCTWHYGDSAEDILAYLQKAHPGFDGVMYFDSFGNLMCLAEDDQTISTQSAFMKVTRKVAVVRNTDPVEGHEINAYLANPRHGYFVYVTCPEISAKTVMEIGAIGSTLESTAVHPVMFIHGEENKDALDALLKNLPPLNRNGIRIWFEKIDKK